MNSALSSAVDSTQGIRRVLVVDDESSIRRSLAGVFSDEGFSVQSAAGGEEALTLLHTLAARQELPNAILLDIWMPGMDGIETLKQLRARYPFIPVIMMSGHATIGTAMEATRLGAMDFIEKPLDLQATLDCVHKVIQPSSSSDSATPFEPISPDVESIRPRVTPYAFRTQPLPGRQRVQKTLRSSAVLYGQGLHSGKKSGLVLEPLPPNSGIHFAGIGESQAVPAHLDYVKSTGFATTLSLGTTRAGTIEHVMSALCALGIANVLVKCNGEVPVMDGSALEFCNLLRKIGLVEQEGEWFDIAIPRLLRFEKNESEWIQIEPAEEFTIEYTLSYPKPVGSQQMTYTLRDDDLYEKEVAPARTFGFVRDISLLQQQGLALGGRFDNFVLIGEEGPINTDLRFPDECVRHKVLDAIGDLYLLGRRLQGKITARMTGHSDNISLLNLIAKVLEENDA